MVIAITEFEWEPSRVPSRPKAEFLAHHRARYRALEEFASLELPREHLGWILKQRP